MSVVAKLSQAAITGQIMYCPEIILAIMHCEWSIAREQATTPKQDVLAFELISFTAYSNLIACILISHHL